MRTKQIQVFKFDELSAEAKERALDKHRDFNVNFDWWDYTLEDVAEQIKEQTGLNVDCNGFTFNLFSKGNSHLSIGNRELFRALREKFPDLLDLGIPDSFGCWQGYTSIHEGKYPDVEEAEFDGWEYDEEVREAIRLKEQEKLKDRIADDLYKVMQILIKGLQQLYDEYFYLTSDEAIIDSLKANEYNFTADGEIF